MQNWSFRVFVLQGTATKCTKNYNARAEQLFYLLNLLFGDVPVTVTVAVVVILNSLLELTTIRFFVVRCNRINGVPLYHDLKKGAIYSYPVLKFVPMSKFLPLDIFGGSDRIP